MVAQVVPFEPDERAIPPEAAQAYDDSSAGGARTLAQTAHFEEQLALSTATLVRIEQRLERIEGGAATPSEGSA